MMLARPQFAGVALALAVSFQVTSGLAAQTVILRADGLVDVEAGRVIQPAVVVIEGDKITSINPATVPQGQIIELKGLTLVPGFMDLHTHLSLDLEGDWTHRAVLQSAADLALRGARNARRTLLAGFTTVRDLGSEYFADVALMRATNAGWVEGPRIFPAGHALSITGGHCDATGYAPGVVRLGPEEGVADGVDGMLRAARYQIKYGARVIKVCATAGVLSFEGPVGAQQFSEAELRAVVEEAARHGIRVAAHAHGTEGILAAVRAGVASIEHGSLLNDEAIALMKEKGTYLVPTTYVVDAVNLDALPPPIRAKADYVTPLAKASLRKAIAAHVKIAFGTDAGVYPHGQNAHEFAALVDRGMTPIEAIRTATLNAADLLGVADRGRIAPGLLADIVGVPGNPLQDIHVTERVSFVMKGGAIYRKP